MFQILTKDWNDGKNEMMEDWNDGVETPVGSTASAALFAVAIYQHSNLPVFQPSNIPFRLHLRLVNVAPTPVLPGFERLNDRVRGAVKMFSSVPVRRGVTAAHMTAGQA
jgi:hypothetical protein